MKKFGSLRPVLAVDGLSFTGRRVRCSVAWPNGAGKTTRSAFHTSSRRLGSVRSRGHPHTQRCGSGADRRTPRERWLSRPADRGRVLTTTASSSASSREARGGRPSCSRDRSLRRGGSGLGLQRGMRSGSASCGPDQRSRVFLRRTTWAGPADSAGASLIAGSRGTRDDGLLTTHLLSEVEETCSRVLISTRQGDREGTVSEVTRQAARAAGTLSRRRAARRAIEAIRDGVARRCRPVLTLRRLTVCWIGAAELTRLPRNWLASSTRSRAGSDSRFELEGARLSDAFWR